MNKQYTARKVVVVGQAPPSYSTSEPFAKSRLFDWLARIGISKEYALRSFVFTALVKTFPGKSQHGHRPPSAKEILADRSWLLQELERSMPDVLIPVGSLAIKESLCDETAELSSSVGEKFFKIPFGSHNKQIVIIPLPHPSGASPWIYGARNAEKLTRALNLLRSEIA